MKIKIALFAIARELLGKPEVEIDLPEPITVGQLRDSLVAEFPDLADLVSRSTIAVDQEFATADQEVRPDSEVALIPPVSGG